jgi:hypothetical protein
MHYLDRNGVCVAGLIWWRDGAPQDVNQDQFWGEGVALLATREGRSELGGVAGPLNIGVHSPDLQMVRAPLSRMSRVEQ